MPPPQRQEPGFLSQDAQLELLGGAEVEVVGRLVRGSNATFLVRCRAGGPGSPAPEAMAVYKPAAGERPLWDFPTGTLHRREAAAYQVSRLLGWDLVPPTLVRDDLPLGPGSLQWFVEHDPERHYFTLRDEHEPVFRRLALFDALCNNADRKSGHCLLDARGRIQAIDNGLTFHLEPKLRTVIWEFAGQPPAAADRADVRRLAKALAEGTPERAGMLELLSEAELVATLDRAWRLGRRAVLPSPRSAWSFPWPPV